MVGGLCFGGEKGEAGLGGSFVRLRGELEKGGKDRHFVCDRPCVTITFFLAARLLKYELKG